MLHVARLRRASALVDGATDVGVEHGSISRSQLWLGGGVLVDGATDVAPELWGISRRRVHPLSLTPPRVCRYGSRCCSASRALYTWTRPRQSRCRAWPSPIGVITSTGSTDTPGRLTVDVNEALPNCPKYITRRVIDEATLADAPVNVAAKTETRCELSAGDERMIVAADQIWLGTYNPGTGADVNLRGGNPGFVRVVSPTEVVWGEYRGNGMFQSSGNLELNGAAGVSVLDFESGDVLQMSGHAVVDWDAKDLYDGAVRAIRFRVSSVRRTNGLTNFRWKVLELSPYNPPLAGAHLPADLAASAQATAAGGVFPQPAVLVKIVKESPVVSTFRFLAQRAPVRFLPGQYASFKFENIPELEGGAEVLRTWTLSETANSTAGDVTLDVSVKRLEGGYVSKWLHDQAQLGQTVTLLGVDGDLTPLISRDDGFDLVSQKLLLVSAGVGVTPMLAIVRGMAAFGFNPSLVMLHQERREEELAFQNELRRREGTFEKFSMFNFISGLKEGEAAVDGRNRCGRISLAAVRELVPDVAERQVYICGPQGFMNSVAAQLAEAGVPPGNVHTESFAY